MGDRGNTPVDRDTDDVKFTCFAHTSIGCAGESHPLRMSDRRPFTDRRAELIAEHLRALGQPLRVKLVDRLANQPTTVQELVDSFGATQQNVSQHLGVLQRAGIVARHKEGTRVRYELVDPHVLPLLEQAEASLERQADELARAVDRSRPAGG